MMVNAPTERIPSVFHEGQLPDELNAIEAFERPGFVLRSGDSGAINQMEITEHLADRGLAHKTPFYYTDRKLGPAATSRNVTIGYKWDLPLHNDDAWEDGLELVRTIQVTRGIAVAHLMLPRPGSSEIDRAGNMAIHRELLYGRVDTAQVVPVIHRAVLVPGSELVMRGDTWHYIQTMSATRTSRQRLFWSANATVV